MKLTVSRNGSSWARAKRKALWSIPLSPAVIVAYAVRVYGFWLTVPFAFPAALAVGYVLHESIGVSEIALFIVIRHGVRHASALASVGIECAYRADEYLRLPYRARCFAALEIPMPAIFVREDNFVPAVALGFGEPYALVFSGHWVEVFSDDELAFIVGRELGHIAAGHTRFHSLLSVNGNENPLVSLIFGAWLRRCALTCDKIGLLCCGSIHAAIRAMGIAAFHEFGRRVDYEMFAQQQTELSADSVMRLGEWLSSEPYATRRIAELRRFMTMPDYTSRANGSCASAARRPPNLSLRGRPESGRKNAAGGGGVSRRGASTPSWSARSSHRSAVTSWGSA